MKINGLKVEGFRTLRALQWAPGDLNLVVGAGGAGKSNLLGLLELVAASAQGRLGQHVHQAGGFEPLLWDGAAGGIRFALDTAPDCALEAGGMGAQQMRYGLELLGEADGAAYRIEHEALLADAPCGAAAAQPMLFLARETGGAALLDADGAESAVPVGSLDASESLLSAVGDPLGGHGAILPFKRRLASMVVYGALCAGRCAALRQAAIARPERRLDADGQNLVPVLHTLYCGDRQFKRGINAAMRAVYGDEFEELEFPPAAENKIRLQIRWKSLQRAQAATELSGGTLRFLFLLTALSSPNLPPVVGIDEADVGLHPAMVPVIAGLAFEASRRSQIILTAMSQDFVDAFADFEPTVTALRCESGETVLEMLEMLDLPGRVDGLEMEEGPEGFHYAASSNGGRTGLDLEPWSDD